MELNPGGLLPIRPHGLGAAAPQPGPTKEPDPTADFKTSILQALSQFVRRCPKLPATSGSSRTGSGSFETGSESSRADSGSSRITLFVITKIIRRQHCANRGGCITELVDTRGFRGLAWPRNSRLPVKRGGGPFVGRRMGPSSQRAWGKHKTESYLICGA